MAKIKREDVTEHLIEYQFNLIELTILDALFNKNWKEEWSITEDQYKKLKKYAISLIKKVFKCNSKKANDTFDWWYKHFGLKINGR